MHITNMTSAMGTRLNVAVSHQTNDKTINSNSKTSGSGDHLSISKSAKAAFQNQSKMSGMVDSLLKQKQSIIDSKNSLIERTTKNSHNLDSIQDQLKNSINSSKRLTNKLRSTPLKSNKELRKSSKRRSIG